MKHPQPAQDPDPIAICGIIISGLSLLLALESKIEARRARVVTRKKEQARRTCKLSLATLQSNCFQVSTFIRSLKSLGKIEPVSHREKGYGAFRLYFTEEQITHYNNQFNSAVQAISAINKVIVEIPLEDISIPEMERHNLLKTIKSLRDAANVFLMNPVPEEGISAAISMSRSTNSLIKQLEQVIDMEPPTQTVNLSR